MGELLLDWAISLFGIHSGWGPMPFGMKWEWAYALSSGLGPMPFGMQRGLGVWHLGCNGMGAYAIWDATGLGVCQLG